MTSAPDRLVELRSTIDAALEAALDPVLARVADRHPSLALAADTLADFVAGGKRVRPALLLLGHEAGGGTDPSAVMGPALALELLHTFALVHAGSTRGR